ncbi:MAG: hypothetical protein IIC99_08890, partial [Chloroflexi bacterium]|nr:hypothetical protein [Chloroflexota bacterium]
NIVNAQYEQLHNQLTALKEELTADPKLTDSFKLDLAVDIESIKDQLAKAVPDRSTIRGLWDSVQKGAIASGLTDSVVKLGAMIAPLFS